MDFPYKKPRIGQLELAKYIVENSSYDNIILVRAPTGFGKTVSVLYGALKVLKNLKLGNVMYAVRTRNELDPVIRECRALGLSFTVIYSIKRMCPLVKDINISPEGFWSICAVLRLRGECKYYTRTSGVTVDDVENVVKNSENHSAVAKSLARSLNICPYFALLQLTNYVEVITFTYPYIFKESIQIATFRDFDVSQTLLIIDEAHNLLNLGSIMSESIGLNDVGKALDEAASLSAEDVVDALRNILAIGLNTSAQRGYKYVGKESLNIDPLLIDKISNLAFSAITRAMKGFEYKLNITKLDFALSKVAKFLESAISENYDVFISKDQYGSISLASLPINFVPLKTILEKFPVSILMSATPPSREFIVNCIKVRKDISEVDVEDFGAKNFLKENASIVIFTGATTSYRVRGRGVYETYRRLVEAVFRHVPKGIMVAVYPSYEFMYSVVNNLKDEKVIVEGSEPLSELMQKIASRSLDKLLLNVVAGGRLTEGVEFIVGEESLIKSVVVVGIPYPQPDDYVELIKRNIVAGGGSYADYYRDIATVRVLQAIGRAIRKENDCAFVVLADRRYLYRTVIRKLHLQPRAVTSDLKKVIELEISFFEQTQ
ncbi:MAG: ATP-dependent DNA helicase [Ignisphaera sp.]|uniref:ATP-dependent DNA helicase n=1 Tax=Ignisphaera aggregans TaxID=334771 RepID=A0A7C4JLA4_9CREN